MAVNPLFLEDDELDDTTPPAAVIPPADPAVTTPPAATTPPPVEPIKVPDQTQSADPKAISDQVMKTQMAVNQANRKMRNDLREKFPELEDSDFDEIIDSINQVGSEYTVNAANANLHTEYAKTKAYDKLKADQKSGVNDRTPVGGTKPTTPGGAKSLEGTLNDTYGKKYGKVPKSSIERVRQFDAENSR